MAVGRSDIVAAARAWIGTPYLHQASLRGAGADCLGLVRGVWRETVGQEPEVPPPYSMDWAEASREEALLAGAMRYLTPKAIGEAVPGDVLLFRMRTGAVAKHLGILSGADVTPRFIHAYARHGVLESALSQPWQRRVVACFSYPERGD